MVKCLFTILLACFILTICSTQQPNVNDFTSATWNSDGARWNEVQTLMNHYGLDLLAIQEAGSIRNIFPPLLSTDHSLPLRLAGSLDPINYENMGVQEYTWNISFPHHVYYFNNILDVQLPPDTMRGTSKQNMAIICKQRADEIIIIPPEVTHSSINAQQEMNQDRTFINRPALGIRIANSIFFNIHAEPHRMYNEAPKLIEVIQNYTRDFYANRTWMAMGDFNRTPDQLKPFLRRNTFRFIQIINSNSFTRLRRGTNPSELDYSVVGGPSQLWSRVTAISAGVIQFQSNSDHKPVRFN